ncbi:hypothetical protein VQ056_10035 [Paenibacillus sp. JTLBN-2024]|jgi:hypothetical protein|uniref:Uncharacterized protein n=1 Tax=Paenibacillus cookii TaxID=157839 RepID=A0ABQ4LZL5_9BACL|nr:hypothetical protein [Paenibacillus cookii]KHF37604.1 hypothetical protein CM49_00124 [Paenibacillus sp. P1XP2]GIO68654.1 hypothetical protein J21TS3_34750 [Paenibacillus cookii]HWO53435.1 hypothetical protein [Paenibacillus cookii]
MFYEDNENLTIMTYTLNSGIKGTVPLSNKQIQEWIECYRTDAKFITAIGKEFFGLNPELVADFKVHNRFSNYAEVIKPVGNRPTESDNTDQLSKAYEENRVYFKVDCKCGTTYTTYSQYYTTKWYCSKCNEIVFLDKKKGKVATDKGDAWYMTNKYYVARD